MNPNPDPNANPNSNAHPNPNSNPNANPSPHPRHSPSPLTLATYPHHSPLTTQPSPSPGALTSFMPPSPLARSGSPSQLGLGGSPSAQLSPGPPMVRFSGAGHASMWKARPVWPAGGNAAHAADWPRLAEAGRGWPRLRGSLDDELALKAACGEPVGRDLSEPCFPHRYESPSGERRLPRPASAAALLPPRPQAEYDRAVEGVRAEAERMVGAACSVGLQPWHVRLQPGMRRVAA